MARNSRVSAVLVVMSAIGIFAESPSSADARSAWIKGSPHSLIELKAEPRMASGTLSLLKVGEKVEVLSQPNGIWIPIKSASGKTGYVVRFMTSDTPVRPREKDPRSQSDSEFDSIRKLRSRRTAAAVMGVRGLQARKETGASELQDFHALEKLEAINKGDDTNPESRRFVSILEHELTPPSISQPTPMRQVQSW
jgi:hypothetical protein